MNAERQNKTGFNGLSQSGYRQKDYTPGYVSVLIQRDVKEQLRDFRINEFGSDSHIERCLITAALLLVLSDSKLHDRWLDFFEKVTHTDTQLALEYRKHRTK